MANPHIYVNPNLIEQIVQQKTAALRTELETANAHITELTEALETLIEGETE